MAPPLRGVAEGLDPAHLLAAAHGLQQVGRRDRLQELVVCPLLGRRPMVAIAAERQQPFVVLLGKQRHTARKVGARADHGELVRRHDTGHPVGAGRVGDIDSKAGLLRALVAQLLEPGRDPRRAPGRRDDQFRGQIPLRARGIANPNSADPLAVRGGAQPARLAARSQLDVGEAPHPAPHVALDERPAGGDPYRPERRASQFVPGVGAAEIVDRREGGGPVLDHLVADSRKKLLDDLLAAHQQSVRLAALRHGTAALGARRQLVAVDHRDLLEGVGEHARREQAGDAAADHYRPFADPSHESDVSNYPKTR